MPKNGPFPSRESDRSAYYQNAVTHLKLPDNAKRLAVSDVNLNTLGTRHEAWVKFYAASQNPDLATKTVNDSKGIADDEMQEILKKIFGDMPQSALTAQDRNVLNLPLRTNTNTKAPQPTTKPKGSVDTSKHLEHTISFVDEETPNSRAKPAGVRGCQIWCKIGSPVVDPSELSYVATDTASPYVHHFNGADAGKVVYYWLRWENTRGEVGPWSDVVMATISA
jgi:hypothetical protein